jgi:carotenoid 1,2-hydratase
VTVIAFVGAVFSPAYYRSRRRVRLAADPLAHCGMHVVVHGDRSAWAMSEWRGRDVVREKDALVLGRSRILRDTGGITIHIDERASPWTSAVRGTIRIDAGPWSSRVFALDGDGRHGWWPVAPRARMQVVLDEPALRFVGTGYHDANAGSEALEQAFAGWSWCRAAHEDRTLVLYDVNARRDAVAPIGVAFGDDGGMTAIEGLVPCELATSRWRIPRITRVDPDTRASVVRELVDAPFYARSLVDTTLCGRTTLAVHEVVDLDRFVHRATQWMLPFRIRGVGWR